MFDDNFAKVEFGKIVKLMVLPPIFCAFFAIFMTDELSPEALASINKSYGKKAGVVTSPTTYTS